MVIPFSLAMRHRVYVHEAGHAIVAIDAGKKLGYIDTKVDPQYNAIWVPTAGADTTEQIRRHRADIRINLAGCLAEQYILLD